MKKRAAVAAVLACLVAALVLAPSASPSGMSPELWTSYVHVRTDLVKKVNSFMATYRSCARSKGFLTKSWGRCVQPALTGKYWPAVQSMDTFLHRAILKVDPRDDCYLAMVAYVSRNQAARRAATLVVYYSYLIKSSSQLRREKAARFVLDRNKATNARLAVNRICAPR
jgi:hypothetical protein